MNLFTNYKKDNVKVNISLPENLEILKVMEKKTLSLNELENWRAHEFCEKHKDCVSDFGAIGGGFSFIFTPTSIGTIVKIKCEKCGEIVDITDFDSW